MSAQLTPIQQVAHAAAYRPEDRARARENEILNGFDAELRSARRDFPVDGRRSSARARARVQAVACARVVAQLHRAGVR